jgi:hypothetical protein
MPSWMSGLVTNIIPPRCHSPLQLMMLIPQALHLINVTHVSSLSELDQILLSYPMITIRISSDV